MSYWNVFLSYYQGHPWISVVICAVAAILYLINTVNVPYILSARFHLFLTAGAVSQATRRVTLASWVTTMVAIAGFGRVSFGVDMLLSSVVVLLMAQLVGYALLFSHSTGDMTPATIFEWGFRYHKPGSWWNKPLGIALFGILPMVLLVVLAYLRATGRTH